MQTIQLPEPRESVSAVLFGLGRLNIEQLIMLHKVKFYRHLFYNCDAFLCAVFLIFLLQNFCYGDMLNSVFRSKCCTVKHYGCTGFRISGICPFLQIRLIAAAAKKIAEFTGFEYMCKLEFLLMVFCF